MKQLKYERGQSIFLFVFAIFAMVAMAALVIDGGNAYFQRRSSQTAADSAALAGAFEWCSNEGTLGPGGTVEEVINQYAKYENDNMADLYENDGWKLNSDSHIEVNVSLTINTFFARIFGRPTVTVTAVAAAGCFDPNIGKGILPLAWACQSIEGEFEWDSEDCKYKALDWTTEFKPLLDSDYFVNHDNPTFPELYIIGDSDPMGTTTGDICEELDDDGNHIFICDIDGDGKYDYQGQADIGWLDLDGGGGSLESDWFDGYTGDLNIHTWIPSETGVMANLYNVILPPKLFEILSIPVFNAICGDLRGNYIDEDGITHNCEDYAHITLPDPNGDEDWIENQGEATYYHLGAVGKFVITCIHSGVSDDCPGHNSVVALNEFDLDGKKINYSSWKSIEGYFVTGLSETNAGVPVVDGGLDLGNYIISLTR